MAFYRALSYQLFHFDSRKAFEGGGADVTIPILELRRFISKWSTFLFLETWQKPAELGTNLDL